MFKIAAIFLIMLSLNCSTEPILTHNGVLILDASNYKLIKKETKNLFVLYHKTDCEYCDYLKTVLAEVKSELSSEFPDVKYALFNTDLSVELKVEEEIQEWPVAKFFSEGYLFNYFRARLSKDNIKVFIQKILKNTKKATALVDDKSFVKFNNLDFAIALCFPELTQTEVDFAQTLQNLFPEIPIFFLEFNSKFDKLIFPNENAYKKYRMIFKRDFDEGDKSFAGKKLFEPNDITGAIWKLKHPKVQVLDGQASDDIFSGTFPALILFDNDLKSQNVKILSDTLNEKSIQGLRLKSKGTEPNAATIMNYLGVKKSDFPCLRIIQFYKGKMSKYKLEGEIEQKNIEGFLSNYKANKLTSYIKNTPTETKKGSKIFDFSRDQYYKYSKKNDVVFVVGLIAQWCHGCNEIHSLFEKTREILTDKKAFVFATVNLDFNDIDEVEESQAPVIQIFKQGTLQKYTGEKNAQLLANELNKNVSEDL